MRWLAGSLLTLASLPAFAQTQPGPANSVGVIGRDSGTGLPCYIGTVSTCGLPASGGAGGGGPATLAAGSVSAGAYVSGAILDLADSPSTGNTINSATANAAYTVTLVHGQGVTAFAVSGLTASGATLTIEASDDGGTTWSSANGIAPSTGLLFTTLTTDQQFRVNTGARTKIRLRVSSTGTGTITISSNASPVSSVVALSSPIPPGSNVIGSETNSAAILAAALAPAPLRSAVTPAPTVADGAPVPAQGSKDGATVTNFGGGADVRVSGAANTTAGSATTLIQLAAVTYKIYMTGLQCFRTDAGTSEIYVTLNDTATSVFGIPPVTSGGGFIFTNMASPLVVTAAVSSKTTLQFTVSTGTTTVYCNAQGYYGA